MHEILFRGKRIDNGEFVFGYVGVFKGKTEIYVPFTEEEEKELRQLQILNSVSENSVAEGEETEESTEEAEEEENISVEQLLRSVLGR